MTILEFLKPKPLVPFSEKDNVHISPDYQFHPQERRAKAVLYQVTQLSVPWEYLLGKNCNEDMLE
jgi:hypothetical protein